MACKGSLIKHSFSPDDASMTMHNALHGRQSDACALEFNGSMEALKGTEWLTGISHIESRTIITDEISGVAILLFSTEGDLCRLPLRSKLPGIPKQVIQRNSNEE